jgi:hypothetical protein
VGILLLADLARLLGVDAGNEGSKAKNESKFSIPKQSDYQEWELEKKDEVSEKGKEE